jgi:diacylglycerol kinase family enzyme
MAGVKGQLPDARLRELWATLRPAAPGLVVALVAVILATASIVVALFRHPLDLVVGLLGFVIAVPAAALAIRGVGMIRRIAVPIAAFAAVPPAFLLLRRQPAMLALVVVLLAVAARAANQAFRSVERRPQPLATPGAPVGRAARPVLFANPRSGGGTAERVALAEAARGRGIECVVLGPGDDLRQLAERAADRGADVLGMAGGDGSQGVVAQVAIEHGLAFVCVPVGTRNHFARDLGLDPARPLAALEAFGDAEERRIDVGVVADRVFVNNVSLGVYARIVGTEGYREHKAPTAWQVMGSVFGPEAQPFDLRFTGPDDGEHAGFQLILVSNGPYALSADRGFGSRGRMDLGVLGIVAVRAGEGEEFPRFAEAWWVGRTDAAQGWLRWQTPQFEVRSSAPIPAGVDGEALVVDPPVRFRSLPGALRVRVPVGGAPLAAL